MTKEEVIQEITSKPKYYAGICEQAYASNVIRAIKAGTCKPETEKVFFTMFGYEINTPALFKKL